MAKALDKRPEPESVPRLTPADERSAVYGGRFALAYLLVVVAFGGMIALFGYLVSRGGDSRPWSSFRPAGSRPFDKAQNIANHVSRRYLHQGRPIALVEAQPPIVSNTVVDGIAVTRPSSSGVGGGMESIDPADKTVMYVFCGQANGCGLPKGAATNAETLLRRESLELALYTFKYVSGVNSIVTLLPPQKGSVLAIYLKRGALKDQLSTPLRDTLSVQGSLTADSISPVEAETIRELTADRLLPSRFDRLPSGQAILLLGSGSK